MCMYGYNCIYIYIHTSGDHGFLDPLTKHLTHPMAQNAITGHLCSQEFQVFLEVSELKVGSSNGNFCLGH